MVPRPRDPMSGGRRHGTIDHGRQVRPRTSLPASSRIGSSSRPLTVPAGITVAFHEHLQVAREVAGHTGRVVPADPQWLLAQGVQEWMGDRSLPLWLADPAWVGFSARDSSRARQAGLTSRPLKQTLAEALAWELTRDPTRPRAAGLSDHDERELLDTLARAELPATPC